MVTRLLATLILLLFSLPIFSQKLVLDSSFTPTPNASVNFLEILGDGKILIAGDFTTINGAASFKLARLNADGSLDTSFNANWLPGQFNQYVTITMMKLLPDGKILLGGELPWNGSIGGNVRLFRLNANGSFDTTLTTIPTLVNGNGVYQVIEQADQLSNGKILVCGQFTKANNNPKIGLARFNNDGTFDSTYTAAINDPACNDLEVQTDGKYLIAGGFEIVNGSPKIGLARLNADDSLDTGFNPPTLPSDPTTTYTHLIKRLSDGRLIVSLIGTSVSVTQSKIAHLNADGSLNMYLPGAGWYLNDAAVQTNGKTLLTLREDFLRSNTDGTDDPSLANLLFSGSSESYPKAVAVAADGKIIIGGNFTAFWTSATGTLHRTRLARFTPEAIPIKPKFDFDGDGRDDMAVYRPSDKIWYLNRSTSGFFSTQFGLSPDKPVAADYDGDGKTDIAVWRPENGTWYWLKSSDFTLGLAIVGVPGDIPQQRNPNGRGSNMVFRPSDVKWWSFGGYGPSWSQTMGVELPGDIPVRDDYDGDGNADLAVFRNGTWIYKQSSSNQIVQYQWGLAGDIPVPADYDGDLRTDYAVFRPSEGIWYIKKSTEGFYAVQWGLANDLLVPADYDGDGKTDIAIYRPSSGVWYILKSTGSYHIEKFGLAEDIPAQLR